MLPLRMWIISHCHHTDLMIRLSWDGHRVRIRTFLLCFCLDQSELGIFHSWVSDKWLVRRWQTSLTTVFTSVNRVWWMKVKLWVCECNCEILVLCILCFLFSVCGSFFSLLSPSCVCASSSLHLLQLLNTRLEPHWYGIFCDASIRQQENSNIQYWLTLYKYIY